MGVRLKATGDYINAKLARRSVGMYAQLRSPATIVPTHTWLWLCLLRPKRQLHALYHRQVRAGCIKTGHCEARKNTA